MCFRDSLIAQKCYLEREQERIYNQLRVLPDGKLVCKHAKGKSYYYTKKNNLLTSLLKNKKLKDEYLFKERLERQLNAIEKNIPLLEQTIKRYCPLTELSTDWEAIEDQQNRFHEEHRVHIYQGVAYRSKSEMLIAMALTSYGIEFKYESRLYVNGRYLYPDFIVKRPKDGRIILWEHFGRMDKDDYRCKNINRLEEYHQEGFYLWDNLIASFDLGKNAIDMDYIDKIIKLYLL